MSTEIKNSKEFLIFEVEGSDFAVSFSMNCNKLLLTKQLDL
jgi:hypothetical protein